MVYELGVGVSDAARMERKDSKRSAHVASGGI